LDLQALFGFILGGSFLGFVEFLLRRHDAKNDRFQALVKEMAQIRADLTKMQEEICGQTKALKDQIEEQNIVSVRVRILRFEEELQREMRHSKDSWDQAISDCDAYEKYCSEHPGFKNGQTAATIEHIKSGYRKRLEKHDFS